MRNSFNKDIICLVLQEENRGFSFCNRFIVNSVDFDSFNKTTNITAQGITLGKLTPRDRLALLEKIQKIMDEEWGEE